MAVCLLGSIFFIMKYTVNINQAAAMRLNAELDFNDIAVLEFIKDFATSGVAETTVHGAKAYYWVSHQLILDELPMLHIQSKSGIKKRVERLIDAGLLVKHPDCDKLGRTFYAFGDKMALLYTDAQTADTHPDPNGTTPRPKRDGYPDPNGTPPPTQTGRVLYNNINNNIIDNGDAHENTLFENCLTTENVPTPPSCAAPPRPKSEVTKTLFRNSSAADRDTFFAAFTDDVYKDIDLEYYYNAVKDWSDTSDTKRTPRGWLATVRTFIRGDRDKNKLHVKQAAKGGGVDWNFARNYLNGDF